MPRRGANIYKRKDGRWEGRVASCPSMSGRRKYISVYGKTYQDVKEKMSLLKAELLKGADAPSLTLQEALEIWFTDKSPYWKPSTYSAYLNISKKYLIPYLGKYKIGQISSQVIDGFLRDIRINPQGSLLSSGYLHNITAVILMTMSHVNRKYGYHMAVPPNPTAISRKKQVLLPSEYDLSRLEQYLLAHIDEDTCLGILIAFYSGIRIGELCALTWENISLKEEVLYIKKNVQRVTNLREGRNGTSILFQTPKTLTSMRSIPLPSVLIPLLAARRPAQGGYVVKGKKNAWVEPRTLQYRFRKILEVCSIENFHFHMLRHSFATRCIDMGFDIKSLSEILGHSNTQITLNLYVHSTMQRKKQLMNLFSFPVPAEMASRM